MKLGCAVLIWMFIAFLVLCIVVSVLDVMR